MELIFQTLLDIGLLLFAAISLGIVIVQVLDRVTDYLADRFY